MNPREWIAARAAEIARFEPGKRWLFGTGELAIIDYLEREPIHMFLTCPKCNARHIDEGEFATKPHHTHACQSCGLTWRPAVRHTVGVAYLPGFKNESLPAPEPEPAGAERAIVVGAPVRITCRGLDGVPGVVVQVDGSDIPYLVEYNRTETVKRSTWLQRKHLKLSDPSGEAAK